jgi:membrane protein DedA with SNARE-associated domain
MGITEYLVTYITQFIAAGGYPTVAFLMVLESMVFPVPSEAVMPFAGFLVSTHVFNFWYALLASIIGSIIGSLISYYIGAWGGRFALKKWGKYLLLNEHHLEVTERFFQKHGESAIFISRFIPIIRHLISIPVGIGKMNIFKFSLFTIAGAGLWNAFLIYVGMLLGRNWTKLEHYTKIMDVLVLIVLLVGIGYWIYKIIKKKKNKESIQDVEK